MSQNTSTISAANAGTIQLGDCTVNRLGFGAMRITGRERVRGSYKGQAFDHTARYSRVWIRREGAWKLALFQETPLPQPGG